MLPNGEYELVDEDDLQRALDQGQITRKQYHEAYVIAHQLMIKIDEDFKTMQDKIMYCYHKIKHKPKAKKPHKHPKHKKNERNHHGHKPKHTKHKQHPNYVSNTQNKQIDSKEQN